MGRVGWPEAEVEPAFARPGKDADRESLLVGVEPRELVRRASEIIWDPVSVQLAAGPVQPREVGGQADDLPRSPGSIRTLRAPTEPGQRCQLVDQS